jgi:HK97 family phage prohead protease
MNGKQIRQIGLNVCGLKVREADGEKASRVIEGYASVFGQRSVNLTPWSERREVYEVMEPGSIDEALIKSSDVVLTAFHNNEKIMGRSVNGEGTLKMSVDTKGLRIECELPETRTADDILELIKRGDITGMSFAYTCDESDSENGVSYEKTSEVGKNGREVWIRHVKKCNGLYDVTIAGHPAYPQTEVGLREAGEAMLKALPEDEPKKEAPKTSAHIAREIAEAVRLYQD